MKNVEKNNEEVCVVNNQNYFAIPLQPLTDKTLSLDAKGFFSEIIYYQKIIPTKNECENNALLELINAGYIQLIIDDIGVTLKINEMRGNNNV